MKILGFSPNGQMVKIGDDAKTAKWFKISEKVKETVTKIPVGEIVHIKSELIAGSHTLVSVAAGVGSSLPAAEEKKPAETKNEEKKAPPVASESKSSGKSEKDNPDERGESIRRQAVGHMTSRTLIAMQGQVNEANVFGLIEKLYNLYDRLVSNK